MKKILVFLFLFFAHNLFAQETFTYGDFSYTINENNEITITGCSDYYSSVNIPSVIDGKTVTTIGDSAFERCNNLVSVYFYNTTPPSIDEYTFDGIGSNYKFYVPTGTISAYSSAQYYPSSSSNYEEFSLMPTTLNGALELLGETMAENLTTMGLIGVSASDGLTTLANDILLIQGGGSDCSQYQTEISNAIEYINGSGS